MAPGVRPRPDVDLETRLEELRERGYTRLWHDQGWAVRELETELGVGLVPIPHDLPPECVYVVDPEKLLDRLEAWRGPDDDPMYSLCIEELRELREGP